MKGKHLALLLAAVLALGAAWFNLSNSKQNNWSAASRSDTKVLDFPINEVSRVTIKNVASEISLVKKDEQWTVQERSNYPANFEQVSSLLRKLWEIKPVQEIKIGASQIARLELIEPGKGDNSGTLVQFLAADGKELAALLVGKKHMRKTEGAMDFGGGSEGFPAGRYLKSTHADKVVLVSETLDEIDTAPTRWISTEFINVEGPKSVSLAGANTWSLSRESATADWQLAEAKPEEKLDSTKTSRLGTLLSASTIFDVLAPEAKLEPIQTATVETFDGFRYVLKIGKEEGDNVPLAVEVSANLPKERTATPDEKPEDKTRLDAEFTAKQAQLNEKLTREKAFGSRSVFVNKNRLEPLLKARKELVVEPPAEQAKPAEPKPVDAAKPAPPVPAAPKVEQ